MLKIRKIFRHKCSCSLPSLLYLLSDGLTVSQRDKRTGFLWSYHAWGLACQSQKVSYTLDSQALA